MSFDGHPELIIGLTLLSALVLRLVAWPAPLAFANPDWVLLVLIYWCLALPERFGVGLAWLTGLWTDMATGHLLGQQALIYALVAYGCIHCHNRLRVFPLNQQLLFVLLLLLGSQLLLFCLEILRGNPHLTWRYWLPSLTGTASWPLVVAVCRFLKRRYLLLS